MRRVPHSENVLLLCITQVNDSDISLSFSFVTHSTYLSQGYCMAASSLLCMLHLWKVEKQSIKRYSTKINCNYRARNEKHLVRHFFYAQRLQSLDSVRI